MAERLFSEVIRRVREARGLTQAEFAARCGRSQAAVAQWESGSHALSEATLEAAARGFGISVRELLAEGLRLLP